MARRAVKAPPPPPVSLEEAAARVGDKDARTLQKAYSSSAGIPKPGKVAQPSWIKVVTAAKKLGVDVGRPWDAALCIAVTNRFLNWRSK